MVRLSLANHIPVRPLSLLERNVRLISKTCTDKTVKMNQYEKCIVEQKVIAATGRTISRQVWQSELTTLTLIVLDSFSLSKTFSYITIIRDISNSHDLKNSFGHAVIATLFQEVHREVRQEEGKTASIMFANSFWPPLPFHKVHSTFSVSHFYLLSNLLWSKQIIHEQSFSL